MANASAAEAGWHSAGARAGASIGQSMGAEVTIGGALRRGAMIVPARSRGQGLRGTQRREASRRLRRARVCTAGRSHRDRGL